MTKKIPPADPVPAARRWYLLIHQLPPEPLYLRARIRQRLSRAGAVALKNSVYVLPYQADCLADLREIAEEAVGGGGEAHICVCEFTDRRTEDSLIERFRAERNADYARLAEGPPVSLPRLLRRFEEVSRIDFFEASGRESARRRIDRLESQSAKTRTPSRGSVRPDLIGKTWATRRGVQIDRIASAWLIRRFLDPGARFRFVDPSEPAREGDVRFDMTGGDFSHEGDACTFETLIARMGLSDPALRSLSEIVHDIDLKDGKFHRGEAAGVEQVLRGVLLACPRDEDRLDRGFALFDELYESFRRVPKEARR